ncbi:DUF502 domain-containing protein [Aromatoleum sp.]|uniref:DUF502 domain-containing protein n=1 Tax=Aromatoleum sp. TaxID=2307007 RepID=UPI002FCC5C75
MNPADSDDPVPPRAAHPVGRHILIGFFTVAPLWVTWLVFDFLLGILASMGTPLLRAAARLVAPVSGTAAAWLLDSDFQKLVAVLLTLASLYAIGVMASLVLGRKLLDAAEAMLARLPLVQTIYGGTKRFLETLRKPPVKGQRVVLISFPNRQMKTIGLVTKVMVDSETGEEIAAVYVPTAPNPTSGYIEIVPLADVVPTDWTMEEAMTFVMTGGTSSPDRIRFDNPPRTGT